MVEITIAGFIYFFKSNTELLIRRKTNKLLPPDEMGLWPNFFSLKANDEHFHTFVWKIRIVNSHRVPKINTYRATWCLLSKLPLFNDTCERSFTAKRKSEACCFIFFLWKISILQNWTLPNLREGFYNLIRNTKRTKLFTKGPPPSWSIDIKNWKN